MQNNGQCVDLDPDGGSMSDPTALHGVDAPRAEHPAGRSGASDAGVWCATRPETLSGAAMDRGCSQTVHGSVSVTWPIASPNSSGPRGRSRRAGPVDVKLSREQVRLHAREVRVRRDAAEMSHGRQVAAQIDTTEPRWHVYFSTGQRALVAFPLWDPGGALVLAGPDPYVLCAAMRRAEAEHAPLATGRPGLSGSTCQFHQRRSPCGRCRTQCDRRCRQAAAGTEQGEKT